MNISINLIRCHGFRSSKGHFSGRPTVCSLHLPKSGKNATNSRRARDLSCSDSPGCEPRDREYGDPVAVGEDRGCRMGSLVTMRGRIGSHSDRCRTIERGFGIGLSVVVVALPIGWVRTVLRCEASSGVGTLADRLSLDRSGSQIEQFIDFGSYCTTMTRDRSWDRYDFSEAPLLNVTPYVLKTKLFLSGIFLPTFESHTRFYSIFT
jgi:hypothetical protein